MALTEYKKKRRFTRTPEPAGKVVQRSGWTFVIQKHDATHLHYDFRLELDGVLKSWAVPKGPSLDPSVKRLAIQVEDHPIAYGNFEGTIPEGEYGGGTVLLWDTGTWEPIGDPHAGFRAGRLKFTLHGEKLNGGWTLVRTQRENSSRSKPQWLLIKERDDEAKPIKEGDVLDEQPLSVASGRDLDEIAAAKGRVWSSRAKSGSSKSARKKTPMQKAVRKQRAKKNVAGDIRPLPRTVDVQLATLTDQPPDGDEWLHEFKFDGYRMICRLDGRTVKFISRNHLDWTSRLNSLAEAARKLSVEKAIFDGEVVALNDDGTTDFQILQNAFRDHEVAALKYYAFDLLYLDGRRLTNLPLEERKRILQDLLADNATNDLFRYSEHVRGQGADFEKEVCRLHLEGMISKRADQPYKPGRSYDWLKIKCLNEDEFVIGGYTEPSGARVGLGALLVGFHDKQGELHYAGKVGTGFDARDLKLLTARLKSLEQSQSPFVDLQRRVGPVRTAHWVKPDLVGQFRFGSKTRDGRLRHSAFLGLREDIPAEKVKMVPAIPVAKAVRKSKSTEAKSAPSKPAASAGTFSGVRLTHPDKVLYPDDGITKLDLATYYRDIADWILPHLAHRPIVLVRCPDGQKKQCFYQKHPGIGTPDTLRQIPIREEKKTEHYLIVDDVDGLISLAQIGALEIHIWGSREDRLEHPDRMIFDLDPDAEVTWSHVVDAARQIREFLQELGLESFVKTTGGKGLHLVVPIDRRHDWDDVKPFCKQVADTIVAAAPDQYTANMSKAARRGKIFIDYLRNGRGATSVVPYSTRAKPGATVSTPLTWDELSPRVHADQFTLRNIRRRLASLKHDPWQEFSATRQSLTGPIKQLKQLSKSL